MPIPAPIANTKNASIHKTDIIVKPFGLITSKTGEVDTPPFIDKAIANTIMPKTSSMIAADTIIVPTLVCSLPSSLNTSTVMPTLVAVIITPIKSQVKKPNERKNKNPTNVPSPSGTSTPPSAIKKAFAPVLLISSSLVSKPAVNITNITPTSAKARKYGLLFIDIGSISALPSISKNIPQIAGPISMPAMIKPKTCGRPSLRIIIPSIFEVNSITAS